jgi:hypothetical protein
MADDRELVADVMAEIHTSLTRAKWGQRKLRNGITSRRVDRLGNLIVEALQVAGEIGANEQMMMQLLPAEKSDG